jgi:hypothetical protein
VIRSTFLLFLGLFFFVIFQVQGPLDARGMQRTLLRPARAAATP